MRSLELPLMRISGMSRLPETMSRRRRRHTNRGPSQRRRWSSRWARPFLASAFSGFHGSGFQLLWVFSWVLRPLLRTLRRFFGFFFLCGAVTRRFHLLLRIPPFRESSSESAVRRFLRFLNYLRYFRCTTNYMPDVHRRRHRGSAPPVWRISKIWAYAQLRQLRGPSPAAAFIVSTAHGPCPQLQQTPAARLPARRRVQLPSPRRAL